MSSTAGATKSIHKNKHTKSHLSWWGKTKKWGQHNDVIRGFSDIGSDIKGGVEHTISSGYQELKDLGGDLNSYFRSNVLFYGGLAVVALYFLSRANQPAITAAASNVTRFLP